MTQPTYKTISPQDAVKLLAENDLAVLADIRSPADFAAAHVEGAFNLNDKTMQDFNDEYDFDQPVIVSCYKGLSAVAVVEYLQQLGYEEVYNLEGGFEGYTKAGLPTVAS